MASSNKQDNHHTLESTLQEEREIHAKIDNLKDEERIAMAVAEHLKNRFIAESREPRDDVTRVTIREMMDAEGEVLNLRDRIGGLKMRLCIVQSRLAALRESGEGGFESIRLDV